MSEPPASHPVRVQILDKGQSGPLVLFRLPVVRIGRDPGCEVCFDDPAVSRVHCAIHRQGDRAILVVGQSRNPTFVNGVKASNAELRPGDVLSICDHKLRFDPPLAEPAGSGPTTLDHLGSRRKDRPPGRERNSDDELQAVLVDDGEDDSEEALELDLGRPDDEHTRVMPRSQIKPPADKTQMLPPGHKGEVVARRGPGRSDDEHTRILPRGAKKPREKSQAVILSHGAAAPAAPAAGAGGDQVDLQRLSVAIQESSSGNKKKSEDASKGPLQNNGVRAALLLLMIALALLAWKDTLFGAREEVPTTRRTAHSDVPELIIDRGERSDAELVADSKKAYDVGCKKMEEHHLQDENLTQAIRKLTEAEQTLELMANPPSLAAEVDAKLKEAEELRDEKFVDALFRYQKLKRAGDYREGQNELEYILRLIADEEDPRYQDAARELAVLEDAMKDRRR